MKERTMRSLSILALAATTLAAPLATAAPPARVPVQAFLTSRNGTPITGARDVRLELFDLATAGSLLHSETVADVQVNRGHFVVHLGDGAPLDLGLFATHDTVWLQITVGDETITPRFRLATLPWAGHAAAGGSAQTLSGLAPAAFATASHSVSWSQLSDKPAGWTDGDNDLARSLACKNGETPKAKGPNLGWTCGADNNTTYTASSGLALTGATFTIPAKAVTSDKLAHGLSYASDLTITGSDQSATASALTVSGTNKATFDGDEVDMSGGMALQCTGRNIVLGGTNGLRDGLAGGKPVRFEYHQLSGVTNLELTYTSTDWQCVIGGFAFYNGDLDEGSANGTHLLWVYTNVKSNGHWEIVAGIKHDGATLPVVDVGVVCFSKRLANFATWY